MARARRKGPYLGGRDLKEGVDVRTAAEGIGGGVGVDLDEVDRRVEPHLVAHTHGDGLGLQKYFTEESQFKSENRASLNQKSQFSSHVRRQFAR